MRCRLQWRCGSLKFKLTLKTGVTTNILSNTSTVQPKVPQKYIIYPSIIKIAHLSSLIIILSTDQMTLREFQIVGRRLPSAQETSPQLYKMRIFAPNEIVAKSRFFYFLRKLKKVKRANGEIVSLNEVIFNIL